MCRPKRKRLRQSEERAGKCQDGVELGEHSEDHGAGKDVVSVGHLVDTVADEAGLLDGGPQTYETEGDTAGSW